MPNRDVSRLQRAGMVEVLHALADELRDMALEDAEAILAGLKPIVRELQAMLVRPKREE